MGGETFLGGPVGDDDKVGSDSAVGGVTLEWGVSWQLCTQVYISIFLPKTYFYKHLLI